MSGETLLRYSLGTVPNLLQAARPGTLNCVASNPDPVNPVTCHSISVTFSIGANAADLTRDSTGIRTPQPSGWTARIDGGVYTARPNSGSTRITDAVLLTLEAVSVNDRIGVTRIFIDEDASDGSHPRELRSTQIEVTKFPTEFTLSNLRAAPDTVESGGSAVLMWTGTNLPGLVTYRLSWVAGGQRRELDVPWIGPRTVQGIDTEPNTVFTLQANVAGLPEPEKRTAFVNVIPHLPVIDRFTGEIEGRQIRLRWSARHADCFIDSVKYAPEGEVVLPLDRICYVLTARNRTRSVRAMLALQFTSTATSRIEGFMVNRLLAAPDASSLVLLMHDDGCQLADGTTLGRRRVLVPRPNSFPVATVGAISTDGQFVFASSCGPGGGTATMFDDRMQPIRTLNAGAIVAAAFSPGAEWLYAITDERSGSRFTLHKYAAATFEKVAEMSFAGSMFHPSAMCTSPSGDRVFACGSNGVFAIDVSNGTMIAQRWSGGIGSWSVFCWRNGDDLRLLLGLQSGGQLLDARRLHLIRTDLRWGRFVPSATELLVVSQHEDGVHAVDRATLSTLVSLPIETRGMLREISSPVAFTAGVLYVAVTKSGERAMYSELTRYAATSAVRVAPALAVDVLEGEGTLVAVAATTEPVTMMVEGDGVVAEAPPGWRVTREGPHFTFTPEEGAAENETLAFTFRGVAEEAEVRIEEAART